METIQFIIDAEKRKAAVEVLRRINPRHKILTALIVVAIIWLIVSGFVFNRGFSPDSHQVTRTVLAGALALIFAGIPLIILLSMRSGVVDGTITARNDETMVLTGESLEYSYYYEQYNVTLDRTRPVYAFTIIPYTSITRIELYEDVQALKVYGTVYICDRPGAPTEESIRKVIDDPDKAYRVFFLYYHDADKLVQLISDRSGKPVTRLQHCTGSLQEVK